MPRLVVPGYPHHVTQRGARRMKTFFSQEDYQYYLDLIAHHKQEAGVAIWAYCLMPNHVHFVAVPEREESLSSLFKAVHRHYSRTINFRQKWKGHLWQERFHSFVMDEGYLHATVRYVELNPVKAGLCCTAEQWQWSSTGPHIVGCDDQVVSVGPMLSRIENWREYLSATVEERELISIKHFTSSGRPAGNDAFVAALESMTGREFARKKPGLKAAIK
jgi:putative transposase